MLGSFFPSELLILFSFLHVSSCASTALSIYYTYIESFEIRKCESSIIVLFQYCFGYFKSLSFSYESQDQCVISAKNGNCNVSDCTKYVNNLRSISILIILSSDLLTWDVFPIIQSFFNFFSLMPYTSQCTSLTLLLLHLFLSVLAL